MKNEIYSFVNKAKIKLKNGSFLEDGVVFSIDWNDGKPKVTDSQTGQQYRISASSAVKMMGKKIPSLKAMEEWDRKGYARSVMGEKVEPDGYDQYGSPSWLIVCGLI